MPQPKQQQETVNLYPRGSIEKAIVGALKSSIDAHGAIETMADVSSAAKRVYMVLKQRQTKTLTEETRS